uniref:receptor protein-tyrosine kinase n=1 Tax=Schistosoma mansoni TaxID=6183 RepID=A0A5K4E9E6_SCHMA
MHSLIHYRINVFTFLFYFLVQHITTYPSSSKEIVCTRADIRHPSSLTRLLRCTVIEGDLFVVFTRIPRDASLPFLREITGSLLVYDVEGPDDLSNLLPNLTLIRGQTLVFGYAVVIKSTSLKNIGLFSLRVIQQGGVRIDSNPQLCYVRTIDWDVILQGQNGDVSSVKIVKNGLCPNTCSSGCSVASQSTGRLSAIGLWSPLLRDISPTDGHCWSMNECQSICPLNCTLLNLTCTMKRPHKCCHPECLAGCYGDGPSMCVACKNVMHENRCVSQCPGGTFKYLNRRCVTEYQCLTQFPNLTYADLPNMSDHHANSFSNHSFPRDIMAKIDSDFTIFNGSCLSNCPVGYKKSSKTGLCYPCGDQCELKHCREFLIHSLKVLDTLAGCYSAKAIYLSIQEGQPEIVALLLDRAFANLRVIHHSLRIVRSSVLNNLNFLRHVRSIGQIGGNISNHPIVFELFGNDNLRDLWSVTNDANNNDDGLQILSNGLIRITQNRQLCPEKIFELFDSNKIKLEGNNITLTQAEREMITITNGDLAYCNWRKFDIKLSGLSSHSVRVIWPYPSTIQFADTSMNANFSHGLNSSYVDELVLMYLFYQPAPKDIPNIVKDRRAYDKNSWRMLTASCDSNPGDNIPELPHLELYCGLTLFKLESATRYVVYVEMKFPLKRTGAVSNLVYFTTLSINPSPPQYPWLEPVNKNSLRLTWMPPAKPSGIIDTYLIWIRILEDNPSDYLTQDFCIHKPNWIHSGWDTNLPIRHTDHINFERGYCDSCSSCPNLHEIEQLSNIQTISSSNENYWPSSVSRWMTDDSGNLLPVNIVDENFSLKSGTVGLIVQKNFSTYFKDISYFQTNPQKTCIQSVNENVKYLTGLSPFTRVLVEIQACLEYDSISHEKPLKAKCNYPPPWFNKKSGIIVHLDQLQHQWAACEYELCSPRSTVINRVNPHVESDNIPVSSIYASSNGPGSIRITWSSPIKPNGLIIHYILRYRPRNHDSHTDNYSFSDMSVPWLTNCVSLSHWATVKPEQKSLTSSLFTDFNKKIVSRSERGSNGDSNTTKGGILIKDLSPGSYEFQILAISLAGRGEWSPTEIFNIPFYTDYNGIVNQRKLANICTITVGAFSLLCFIFGIIWYKARRYYLKVTAWTSNNPDYCTIYEVDDWEITKDDVDVLHWKYPIGRGSFGTVYKGVVKQLKTPAKLFYNNPRNIPVAIKTISMHSTLFDHRDFINEACFMKQFQSYHLVRLLGLVTKTKHKHKSVTFTDRCINLLHQYHFGKLCLFVSRILKWTSTLPLLSSSSSSPNVKQSYLLSSSISPSLRKQMLDGEDLNCHTLGLSKQQFTNSDDTSLFNNIQSIGLMNKVAPESPLVIMQLMAKGDLASYLRYLGDKGQGSVNSSQAYLWATQIADGMAYLSAKQDLAARNCLVDSSLTVKIGDFGLCRDVYGHNYYHKTSHAKLPIRWMAPESLQTAYFTTQSDVWSYGVVLWEIVTMACLPYRGMSHEEVVKYVLSGKTLLSNGSPTNCPELFRALMLHCWNFNPLKRPTFLGLCALLSPCFGDAKFRLASFFYHGEQSFVNRDNRSKVLEAPAVSLGKLNISCNQDPAHALASALSTLFCGTDEDSSYDYSDRNIDPPDDFSAPSMQFGAISRTATVNESSIGSGHFSETRLVNCSSEDVSLKQNDNGIALSEVQCLLRLCEPDSNLAVPAFVDSESFPLISNHIMKFDTDECTNFELSRTRNVIA